MNLITVHCTHFQCTEEQWSKIFDINVKSAFLLTKSVVPEMEKRGKGVIVYISSIGGLQPIKVKLGDVDLFDLPMDGLDFHRCSEPTQ